MNEILSFEGHDVRMITKDGEPWWVVSDVCDLLGISNARETAGRLDKDDVDLIDITDAIGRQQKTYITNEPGLYSLVIRSDKPQSRAFKRWITKEVLPSIRKTGRYEVPQAPQDEFAIMRTMIDALELSRKRITVLEGSVGQINSDVYRLECRVDLFGADTHYRTIRAFFNERKKNVPLATATAIGRRAAKLCRERGVEIGTVADERHGSVKSYPSEIIDAAEKQVQSEKATAKPRARKKA